MTASSNEAGEGDDSNKPKEGAVSPSNALALPLPAPHTIRDRVSSATILHSVPRTHIPAPLPDLLPPCVPCVSDSYGDSYGGTSVTTVRDLLMFGAALVVLTVVFVMLAALAQYRYDHLPGRSPPASTDSAYGATKK